MEHVPDSIEFHILELPKFTKSAEELADPDIWLYFLRHAEKMDKEALPAALQLPLVYRALEELEMLTKTDEERERYEARRKAQLDYNTGIKVARMEGKEEGREEGREEGLEKGEKIGMIHLCEKLLNRPQTAAAELAGLSLDDLTRLADTLQAEVLKKQ